MDGIHLKFTNGNGVTEEDVARIVEKLPPPQFLIETRDKASQAAVLVIKKVVIGVILSLN